MRTLLLFVSLFLFPQLSMAAGLAFSPTQVQLAIDEIAEVSVVITEVTEPIGAISGVVELRGEGVVIESIQTKDSFVSWWIQEPTEQEGRIEFVGMIPHGFTGAFAVGDTDHDEGALFTVQLRGVSTTTSTIVATDMQAYTSADSPEPVVINSSRLPVVVQGVSQEPSSDLARTDLTSPHFTDVRIVTEDNLHDGRPSLIYRTEDTGSGIWYVEISTDNQTWRRITSPHDLSQELGSELGIIKVVDKAGNSTTTTVVLPDKAEDHNVLWSWLLLLLVGLVCIYVACTLFRKRTASDVAW